MNDWKAHQFHCEDKSQSITTDDTGIHETAQQNNVKRTNKKRRCHGLNKNLFFTRDDTSIYETKKQRNVTCVDVPSIVHSMKPIRLLLDASRELEGVLTLGADSDQSSSDTFNAYYSEYIDLSDTFNAYYSEYIDLTDSPLPIQKDPNHFVSKPSSRQWSIFDCLKLVAHMFCHINFSSAVRESW